VRTLVAASQATPASGADAPAGPQTLHWDGQPQGWWSRNGLTVGLGVLGAIGGGFAGGMIAAESASHLTPLLAAAAGAALVGGGIAGVTHLIRRSSDTLPAPPSGDAPTLPADAVVPDVVGGELPRTTDIAEGGGHYWSWDTVVKTRYRDGHSETYTDQEYRMHYFSFGLDVDHGQVGSRSGYGTVDEAARDAADSGNAVALRRQGDRLVAYDLRGGSHWNDIGHFDVQDPATVAVIAPDGDIWRRDTTGTGLHEDGHVDRQDPIHGLEGNKIGEHQVRYRSNPNVDIGIVRSGAQGYADVSTALGDAHARAGDQAVIAAGGRFHVADVSSPTLDRSIPNDGFTTSRDARDVVAVEQQGGTWAPLGDWFVAPQQQ
jgi:hypothetical protein